MASKKDVLLGILGVASAGLTGGPLGAVNAGLSLTRRRKPGPPMAPPSSSVTTWKSLQSRETPPRALRLPRRASTCTASRHP